MGSTNLTLSNARGFKLPPVLPIVFYDGATKWTSGLNLLDRTELHEIFYKYIPKFEYELVDLNKYSRDDLVSFGNLLSLILIVDKVRKAEDLELLNTLPDGYLDNLKLNVPDHLLKLLADCIRLFLIKAEVQEVEINTITEKLYQRRFVDMFDVQFSFKEIRQEIRQELRQEVRQEIRQELEKEIKRNQATEIAKKLLHKGMPIKEISDITGLNEESIERVDDGVGDIAVQSVCP